MDMKKKKLIKLGVTAACLIVLYALCIYMDQAITATSRLYMLITVVRKSAVYALVAVSMILLIVVLGGLGSVTGSCIASFLFIACSEWWLRGLDNGSFLGIESAMFRSGFRLVVFSVIIMVVVLFFRKGLMGQKELPDLFKKRKKAPAAPAQAEGGAAK